VKPVSPSSCSLVKADVEPAPLLDRTTPKTS